MNGLLINQSVDLIKTSHERLGVGGGINASSGYEQIGGSKWPSVCKFAEKEKKKKLFRVVKYHLIAIFQLYGLLHLSLSKLSLYPTVKRSVRYM